MKLSRRHFIMTLMFCVVFYVLVVTLPSSVADLEPQLEWENTFGGTGDYVGWSVQVADDGGYIITGYTVSSGTGGRDIYLVRADSSGNRVWSKTFGGTGEDYGRSVQGTGDGGYIITGNTYSSGAGGRDVYLVKTDSSGNRVWSKTFGGTGEDYGRSIQVADDGGYIITGYTYSSGAGGADLYLVKTDSSGNLVWENTFGGTGDDAGRSVQVTDDGGYIITGYTESSGAGGADLYLVRTDSSGNLVWENTFGGTDEDAGRSIQVTDDGGYIITGYTESSGAGGADLYLVKTDSSGNLVWTKTFGGTGTDLGWSVQVTGDGGYIITGYTMSSGAGGRDLYLVRTDSSGNLVWEETFGGTGEDYGRSVQVADDGGYIIAGTTGSFGTGGMEIYLVKTLASESASGKVLMANVNGPYTGFVGEAITFNSSGSYDVDGIIVEYRWDFGDESGYYYGENQAHG